MKKIFTVLFALITSVGTMFAIEIQGGNQRKDATNIHAIHDTKEAGNITIRLYVAEDAGIDLDKDAISLKLITEEENGSWTYSEEIPFVKADGRWLIATCEPNPNEKQFRLFLNSEDMFVTGSIEQSQSYELFTGETQYSYYWSYANYCIEPINEESVPRHNITPTELKVQTENDITTFSWKEGTSESDTKTQYAVVLVKDGKETWYYTYGTAWASVPNPFSHVISTDIANPETYDSWYVVAKQSKSGERTGCYSSRSKVQSSFTLPAKTHYVSDLSINETSVNHYTLSWKWNGKAQPDHFRIGVYYKRQGDDDYESDYTVYYTKSRIELIDGLYQTTIYGLPKDTTYVFMVTAWATEQETSSYSSSSTNWEAIRYDQKYIVSEIKMKNLGEVSYNLLIPSDTDIPDEEQVFLIWDKANNEKDTVQLVRKEGRWWRGGFTVDKPNFSYSLCTFNNDRYINRIYSAYAYEATLCYECIANSSYYNWSLKEVACDAPDHDYRASNFRFTPYEDGRMLVEWDAKDIADGYEIAIQHDKWYIGYDKIYSASKTNSVIIYNTRTDTLNIGKVYIWAYQLGENDIRDRMYCYQEVPVQNVQLLPSKYIAKDLTAETQDSKTYTFKWNKTLADFYVIQVRHYDYSYSIVETVTDNKFTTTLDINGLYYVSVASYSWLDEAHEKYIKYNVEYEPSISIAVTNATDYSISNLSVSLSEGVAHITWDMNSPYAEIQIQDDDYQSYIKYDENRFLKATSYDFVIPEASDKTYTVTLTPYKDFDNKLGSAVEISFTNDQVIKPTTYTVTASPNNNEFGFVFGGGTYKAGKYITLRAIPYEGYVFVKWSNGETQSSYSFEVDQDVELTAIFVAQQADESEAEVVTPQAQPVGNNVVVTWPAIDDADTYTIEIKKGEEVVCLLRFDALGMLVNISLAAPARSGNPYREQTATQINSGWQYAIYGLDSNTEYTYTLTVKKKDGTIVYEQSVNFITEDSQDVENISLHNEPIKIFFNGQIFILRGDKTYTLTGQEL